MNYEAFNAIAVPRGRRYVSAVRGHRDGVRRSEIPLTFDPVEAALEKARERRLSDAK